MFLAEFDTRLEGFLGGNGSGDVAHRSCSTRTSAEGLEVQLREDSGEIHLLVVSSGKGFDVEAGLRSQGLGLSSMRERVRLMHGTITIESTPMKGTRILVRLPLMPQAVQRLAG